MSEHKVIVDNTMKRKQAIQDQIAEILATGSLKAATAEQLCGRLGFAAGQLFGRTGATAQWHLRRRSRATGAAEGLSDALVYALQFWSSALARQPPRTVPLRKGERPAFLFTDGCYDAAYAGIGAVLVDFAGGLFDNSRLALEAP